MGLRHEEGFELQFSTMDLPDVAKLFKRGDAFDHNGDLAWAVMDFLDSDGFHRARVNDA
jgi:hypothetical protein